MMIQSRAPIQYWYHALRYAVMLQNRTIRTALGPKYSPYALWHGRKPNLSHFHPFGCMVYQHVQKAIRGGKFEPVTSVGFMIGRSEENRNFEVLDLETNKLQVSQTLLFSQWCFQ